VLEKTQQAAIAAISKPIPDDDSSKPLVIQTAAFEISQKAYDELVDIFRSRGYLHALGKDCLILDNMAFTRRPDDGC
jgi:hypothetical protein